VQQRSGSAPPPDAAFKPLSATRSDDSSAAGNSSGGAAAQPWSWSSYHSNPVMLDFLSRLAGSSKGACGLDWLSPTR
jgi:hypothetical protein